MERTINRNIETHLKMLGMKVRDRVTGFEGVVISVSFDLYGCIQAIVSPGLNKDGEPGKSQWFDILRLVTTSHEPVMDVPNFEVGIVAEGKQGAAEKPEYPQR